MPDDELFAAAKSGGLDRPEQIAAQAERMLKDERAKDGLRDFHLQWLGIYGVDELEKDDIFTTYSPEVAKAMLAETAAFVDATLFGRAGHRQARGAAHLEHLLRERAAGQALRRRRGHRRRPSRRSSSNPAQRAGILTHGSYLARHSKEVDSFPIARGVHVLRQVLCQEIPEPNIELPPAPEQKQRA